MSLVSFADPGPLRGAPPVGSRVDSVVSRRTVPLAPIVDRGSAPRRDTSSWVLQPELVCPTVHSDGLDVSTTTLQGSGVFSQTEVSQSRIGCTQTQPLSPVRLVCGRTTSLGSDQKFRDYSVPWRGTLFSHSLGSSFWERSNPKTHREVVDYLPP